MRFGYKFLCQNYIYSITCMNPYPSLNTIYSEIFTFFVPHSYRWNFYPVIFLSCINDYIEPMVIFTPLKIYDAWIGWLGEIFVQKILAIQNYNIFLTYLFFFPVTAMSLYVTLHVHRFIFLSLQLLSLF